VIALAARGGSGPCCRSPAVADPCVASWSSCKTNAKPLDVRATGWLGRQKVLGTSTHLVPSRICRSVSLPVALYSPQRSRALSVALARSTSRQLRRGPQDTCDLGQGLLVVEPVEGLGGEDGAH
jgi:hypothetical protein